MAISPADVKSLRDRTNAPMMDCKSALTEAGGDMDKAIQILRERNKIVSNKRAGNETAEGRVAIYIDPAKKIGGILELRCESAPVAKSDQFLDLANDLVRQVVEAKAGNVEELLQQPYILDSKKTVTDRINDTIGLLRENIKPHRFTRLEGLLGEYCHHDGSVAVLLQVGGTQADTQLLRDICMHVAAKNPVAAKREDVAADLVEKEREIAKNQAAALGKPANIADKIAEGKLKTWFAENVLVEQPFVKDETKSISDLLKSAGLTMGTFVRFKVGELAQ